MPSRPPFRPVRPGAPFEPYAAEWNKFIEAAKRGQPIPANPFAVGAAAPMPNTGVVLVKNASGADVSRFAVLGISGVLFTPTDNEHGFAARVVLTGITPTIGMQFVVCQQPIKANNVGSAAIAGATVALVDFATDGDQYADVKNSSSASLQGSGGGSARVLYKEDGTGVKKAVVLLATGGASYKWGKITASSQIGSDMRWTYTWTEQEPAAAGTFVDKSGGLAGQTAYNTLEAFNTGSGTYGNGISQANLDGTGFEVVPIGNGAVVQMWPVNVSGSTEWRFTAVNAVDGECP